MVSLFETYCRDGKLELAKQEYKKELLHNNNDYAFKWACRNGHIRIIKWLYEQFEKDYKFESNTNELISMCAKKGHLNIVKFLYDNKIADNLDYNWTLLRCIEKNELSIVKYTYGRYEGNKKLVDLNFKYNNGVTLYNICYKNKYWDLLKWFVLESGIHKCQEFPEIYLLNPKYNSKKLLQYINVNQIMTHICVFGTYDLLMKYKDHEDLKITNDMLSIACKNGKQIIVNWMIDNHLVDIHYKEEQPFRYAVKNGLLQIAKTLWDKSNHTINIHAKDEQAFRLACSNNHFELAEWLLKISNDTIDTHTRYDEVYLYGCQHVGIRKLLKDQPPLIIPNNERFASIKRRKGKFMSTRYLPNENSIFWQHPDSFFVEIPKTGTISIRSQLNPYFLLSHIAARTYPTHKLKTIVRNPYSRLVSAYFFIKRGGHCDTDMGYNLIVLYPTFDEFVLNWLDKKYIKYNDPQYEMFVAQIEYVIDDKRQIILDKDNIGRFENIQKDAKRLFNIDNLPHYNSTNYGDWKQYYKNKEVRDKVYKLYKEDFEAFGYDKEICF